MFRRYALFFLLALCCPKLYAQGNQPRVDLEFYNVLPLPDNEFVAVLTDRKASPSRLKFARFNQEEEMLNEAFIELENRGLRGQLESVFFWNEKINVLHSVYYPGPQRNNLILTQYHPLTFAVDTAVLVSEAYTPGRYRVPFGYSISPDSSKLQFYSWSYALPEDPAKMEIRVMDRTLQTLWEKRYVLPYDNERLYLYKSLVNNAGEAYIMAEYYQGTISPYSTIQEDKVDRFVLLFSSDDPEALRYSIRLDNDPVIQHIKFVMDRQNNVIGAGFYSDKKLGTYSGIFSFRIDHQTRQYDKRTFPISKEVFAAAAPKNKPEFYPEKGKRGFFDFFVNQLVADQAGNFYLVAEQISEVSYYLEYGDVLIAKITPSQKMDWLLTVPKKHKSLYQESIFSYGFAHTPTGLFLIFNDNPENYLPNKRTRYHLPYEGGPTANVLVQVEPEGTVRYRFMNKQLSMTLVPSKTYQLSDQALAVYGELSNKAGQTSGLLELIPLRENP